MGKKPSSQTSAAYGSFIVSILFRSVDFMGNVDPKRSREKAQRLEKTLQAIFILPEIKEFAATAVAQLNAISANQWHRGVRDYMVKWFELLSKAAVEKGRPALDLNLAASEKCRIFLTVLNWPGNLTEFEVSAKEFATDFLKRISVGDNSELDRLSAEILAGVISDDPKKAVELIKLCLVAFGGSDLEQAVDTAAKNLLQKLNSSMEFKASVELAEKQQQWGGLAANQKFEEAWDNIRPKVMRRIKDKNLAIPGSYETDRHYLKTWGEEKALVIYTLFHELLKRASENPFKLISDVWNGSLPNSLIVAAENKLRDEIRYKTAKKRDIRQTKSLPEDDRFNERIGQPSISNLRSEDPLDSATDNSTKNVILDQLTEDEKTIATLLDEGFLKKEIAIKMGKSPAWISQKLKGMREKLKPFIKN